ncbi:hypothetical protein EAO71_10150 [Streptomyces sp. ms191]|nr:hypothetical protein EAO71_10150 [Streptomyces sp. ms191]
MRQAGVMTTSAEAGRAATMRGRRGPGLLLPLGDAEDGAWLTESAARAVLLRAAGRVPGVVPGALRVNLLETEGGAAPEPPLPVPPGGLPPGPLRVTAEFAAAGDRPLPGVSDELRAALFAAAATQLGIRAAGRASSPPVPLPHSSSSPQPAAFPARGRGSALNVGKGSECDPCFPRLLGRGERR